MTYRYIDAVQKIKNIIFSMKIKFQFQTFNENAMPSFKVIEDGEINEYEWFDGMFQAGPNNNLCTFLSQSY